MEPKTCPLLRSLRSGCILSQAADLALQNVRASLWLFFCEVELDWLMGDVFKIWVPRRHENELVQMKVGTRNSSKQRFHVFCRKSEKLR